jgi:hypothetical protein
VSGEREEEFVEHGRGNGKSPVRWRGRVFRVARRWQKAMSKLKSSNRHIERVALRACLDADGSGMVGWTSTNPRASDKRSGTAVRDAVQGTALDGHNIVTPHRV